MIAGKHTDERTMNAIRKDLGLDLPLHEQLGLYLNDLSPISIHKDTPENQEKYEYSSLFTIGSIAFVAKKPYLRRSFQTRKRVDETILDKLEGTFWLAITAITFATIFGIIFGMIAALNFNKFWDHALITTSILGISAPSFVSAILISMVFGFYLSEYTGLNMTGYMWEPDVYNGGRRLDLKNLILPAFTLGIRPLAIITQLTRSSMVEVMQQDYIRTGRAKGLGNMKLVLKHALKNALNPVVTAVSGWLASLMAGAFFVEYIFSWQGLGTRTIKAVEHLDLPVIMGVTLVVAMAFIVINIFVDLLYALLDPRVRLQ
jgi:peptide/nickel transport system permease protein